jgi:hypothetical protein
MKIDFSKPDPAMKRMGYWVAGGGVVLTLAIGISSFFAPQLRGSTLWKVPPCLILAGLALEAGEVVMSSRSGGRNNDDL